MTVTRGDLKVGEVYWLRRKKNLAKVEIESIDDQNKIVFFRYVALHGYGHMYHQMSLPDFYQKAYLKSHSKEEIE